MLAQEIYRDGGPGSGFNHFNQFSDFTLLRGPGSCPSFDTIPSVWTASTW
jgi:hypothetical protein